MKSVLMTAGLFLITYSFVKGQIYNLEVETVALESGTTKIASSTRLLTVKLIPKIEGKYIEISGKAPDLTKQGITDTFRTVKSNNILANEYSIRHLEVLISQVLTSNWKSITQEKLEEKAFQDQLKNLCGKLQNDKSISALKTSDDTKPVGGLSITKEIPLQFSFYIRICFG